MIENRRLPIDSQKAAHTASSIRLWPVLLTLANGIGEPLKIQPMLQVIKNIDHDATVIWTDKS